MSVLTIDRHPADDKISPQLAPSRLDTGELRQTGGQAKIINPRDGTQHI